MLFRSNDHDALALVGLFFAVWVNTLRTQQRLGREFAVMDKARMPALQSVKVPAIRRTRSSPGFQDALTSRLMAGYQDRWHNTSGKLCWLIARKWYNSTKPTLKDENPEAQAAADEMYNSTPLNLEDENPEAEAAAAIHLNELFSLYKQALGEYPSDSDAFNAMQSVGT
ncbi:hypothetical protein T484DRAFT_1763979 [Baffinella frigidus]|nr:hypothetical protein T484DRAFT_1763979 [Cryptophyta sp. CCMP2293]